ncbi:hypothetical protein OPV22_031738 [Ensete ventricosum]|uniref:ELM2 domain-containing protein n=1 Tax=Ensete ventricosum TaxID=4639 RepID=A0AAV8PTJ1_ENSVE|nr:hypothetical protein OPV22_031738 [Ensete ventricosum]
MILISGPHGVTRLNGRRIHPRGETGIHPEAKRLRVRTGRPTVVASCVRKRMNHHHPLVSAPSPSPKGATPSSSFSPIQAVPPKAGREAVGDVLTVEWGPNHSTCSSFEAEEEE